MFIFPVNKIIITTETNSYIFFCVSDNLFQIISDDLYENIDSQLYDDHKPTFYITSVVCPCHFTVDLWQNNMLLSQKTLIWQLIWSKTKICSIIINRVLSFLRVELYSNKDTTLKYMSS